MSEEMKDMAKKAIEKLRTLPEAQQTLCVGFVLGAAAVEAAKEKTKEAG